MANHKSAEKRARQNCTRHLRNIALQSRVHTTERKLRQAVTHKAENVEELLRRAFSAIQKAKGTIHRNTIKRKMAQLAKVASSMSKSSSTGSSF